MFRTFPLPRILDAARLVVPWVAKQFDDVAVGWTSIPVLNACAVSDGAARAIALNLRLSGTLRMANSLIAHIQRMPVPDDWRVRAAQTIQRDLRAVLLGASAKRVDDVLAQAGKHYDADEDWVARQARDMQMLFVLLHEYAHLTCGHLEDRNAWVSLPSAMKNATYFGGSSDYEYEADRVAFLWLLHPRTTDLLYKDFYFVDGHIPILVLRLFAFLNAIIGLDQDAYYKIPRSHPHPIDRARRLAEIADDLLVGPDELELIFENDVAFAGGSPILGFPS